MLKNAFLEKFKNVYLCCLVMYALLREVIVLQNIVGNPLLTYSFFGTGLLLIAVDLFVNKNTLKASNIVWLILFLSVCIISSFVNMEYGIVENAKAIGWMMLMLFLIYPTGAQNKQKQVRLVFATFSIVMTVLVLVSIPMYFFDVGYTYYKANGIFTDQGFSFLYSRLWGVFQEANYAAIYAEVAAYMTIYLAVTSKKRWIMVTTICQVVLIFSFVVLSGSRTAKLVLLIASAWIAFCAANRFLSCSSFKKVLACILAPFLVMATLVGVLRGFTCVLPYAKMGVQMISSSANTKRIHKLYDSLYEWGGIDIVESSKDPVDNNTPPLVDVPNVSPLDRTDLDDEDISNGRFNRWEEGWQLFLKVPVFGTSPRGATSAANHLLPDSNLAEHQFSISNSYLEVLVCTGCTGAFFAFGFLLLSAVHILSDSLKKKFEGNNLLLHGIVLTAIISALLESDIFFILTANSISFWFVLGVLNGQRKDDTNRILQHWFGKLFHVANKG